MYTYYNPVPIKISLIDKDGFRLRKLAADYIADNINTTGAERGSKEEQAFGALAEIVVRNRMGLPELHANDHPLGFDILSPKGVKIDVKCRGGAFPFKEEYESSDGINRESKHNLWARQLYDDNIDADIFLLTHLETPKDRLLPGSTRQRKWNLYICGWVSKLRAKREGVYLPRGSLTEQGRTWFTYRGQEIEFYNKNLNGLKDITSLGDITLDDVEADAQKIGGLNLTTVDSVRIAYDLVGRGVIGEADAKRYIESLQLSSNVKPILHPNQYYHLLRWLSQNNLIDRGTTKKMYDLFDEVPFTEI